VVTWPALPGLQIADWIRSLGPVVTERERSGLLDRVTRALGFDALWTFAPVEDDLFVRDCAGPVPVDEETAAVLDLLTRRVSGARNGVAGLRGETVQPRGLRNGHPLAVIFRSDGRGLVLVARFGDRPSLRVREVELLGALTEVLRTVDLADQAAVRDLSAHHLNGRLDRAEARSIREALRRAAGDWGQAAVLLGVGVDRLAREIARLGLL